MSRDSAYEAMKEKWRARVEGEELKTPEEFLEELVDVAAEHLAAESIEAPADGAPGPARAEHLEWLAELMAEVEELMRERGAKYGPGNIAQFGDYGVLVRLSDKLSRMQHSLEHDHADESVEDTWKDVVGYGLIGLAWSRGLWPGSFKDPKKQQVNLEPEDFNQD